MDDPELWDYGKDCWKIYTEDWTFAKHLRRMHAVENAGTYFDRKGQEFGWDFILRGWSLKYEVMSYWRRKRAAQVVPSEDIVSECAPAAPQVLVRSDV